MSSIPLQHSHTDYRPDIDGLRAFAILVVVIFHAFPNTLRGGYVGVDIFFVISGFLISRIIFQALERGNFSIKVFYARRINRIFPALITVLSACLIAGWLLLLPKEFERLGKHVASGAGFVQNFVLMNEAGYFDVTSELKPLLHLWSLAIEEQYYLLYPILIWFVWRIKSKAVPWVIVLLGMISFFINTSLIKTNLTEAFFMPQARVWELFAGGIFAYFNVYSYKRSEGASAKSPVVGFMPALTVMNFKRYEKYLCNFLGIFGLLLLIYSVIYIDQGKKFPGTWALVPVLGACLIIAAGPGSFVNAKVLGSRVMVSIGLISYPLYLWHWPLLSFARIMESELPSIEIRIAVVVLSFLLAWLTYRLVERPIRFGRFTNYKIAVLSALMIVVGLTGWNIFRNEGFLTEEMRKARNILSIRSSSACEENDGLPKLEQRHCVITDPKKKPEVLLIGDSHARSLYPGLGKIYLQNDISMMLIAEGGCPPLYNVEFADDRRNKNCYKVIDQGFDYLLSDSSVKTVILAMLGGYGYMYGNKDRHLGTASLWKDAKSGADGLAHNLRMTLDRLSQSGKEIVFVLDWPDLDFDPNTCLDRVRLSNREPQHCAIPRNRHVDRTSEYHAAVLSVLKDYPSIRIFNAAHHFCDEQYCWGKMRGEVLYADRDHMSAEGSEYIASRLFKEITEPAR